MSDTIRDIIIRSLLTNGYLSIPDFCRDEGIAYPSLYNAVHQIRSDIESIPGLSHIVTDRTTHNYVSVPPNGLFVTQTVKETSDKIDALLEQYADQNRWIVLVAPSWFGKSSLLRMVDDQCRAKKYHEFIPYHKPESLTLSTGIPAQEEDMRRVNAITVDMKAMTPSETRLYLISQGVDPHDEQLEMRIDYSLGVYGLAKKIAKCKDDASMKDSLEKYIFSLLSPHDEAEWNNIFDRFFYIVPDEGLIESIRPRIAQIPGMILPSSNLFSRLKNQVPASFVDPRSAQIYNSLIGKNYLLIDITFALPEDEHRIMYDMLGLEGLYGPYDWGEISQEAADRRKAFLIGKQMTGIMVAGWQTFGLGTVASVDEWKRIYDEHMKILYPDRIPSQYGYLVRTPSHPWPEVLNSGWMIESWLQNKRIPYLVSYSPRAREYMLFDGERLQDL